MLCGVLRKEDGNWNKTGFSKLTAYFDVLRYIQRTCIWINVCTGMISMRV